ncbi:MAG: radical SAM protein [Candidatus Diapherotrites archaeon]
MQVALIQPPKLKGKNINAEPLLPRCTGVPTKAPYLWPPIGLAYVASYLLQELSISCQILDAQAEDLSPERTAKEAARFDVVILNTSIPAIYRDLEICEMIKKYSPETKIGLIGTFASFFHKDLVKNEAIDFVARGEPEKPLRNALKYFSGKSMVAAGLTIKKDHKILCFPNEKPLKDLEIMPFAARQLLNYNKYYDILTKGKRLDFLISSRGCPFSCNFCSSSAFSKKYRERSAGSVLDECYEINELGHDDITFFDDTFTINKRRLLQICAGLSELNINWRCLSRTDTVDKEMLISMYNSGCYQIHFGVESGSQEMLENMNKGTKIEDVKKVFKMCNDVGIETVAFFIVGYPGETEETIEKTKELANELDADFATFNIFTPLPGSKIFYRFSHDGCWENYDFCSKSFCKIPTPVLKKEVSKAYRYFYLRPGYIFRRIKKSGFKRVLLQNIKFWLMNEGILWDVIRRG